MPTPPERYLTTAEAAAALGLDITTVCRRIRRGEIHAVKAHPGLRAPYLVSADDVENLLHPAA